MWYGMAWYGIVRNVRYSTCIKCKVGILMSCYVVSLA